MDLFDRIAGEINKNKAVECKIPYILKNQNTAADAVIMFLDSQSQDKIIEVVGSKSVCNESPTIEVKKANQQSNHKGGNLTVKANGSTDSNADKNGANQQQTQIGESHTAPVYKARILQKLIYGNKIGERRKQRTKNQEKNPQKFTHNNFIGGNGFGE